MTPQDILLIVYGLTQLTTQVLEFLQNNQGLTPEEFAAEWEKEKNRFNLALDLWKKAGQPSV